MSNYVEVTQGAGTNMATDLVENLHYPKVKLAMGGDGTAVSNGVLTPLFVDIASGNVARDTESNEKFVRFKLAFRGVPEEGQELGTMTDVAADEPLPVEVIGDVTVTADEDSPVPVAVKTLPDAPLQTIVVNDSTTVIPVYERNTWGLARQIAATSSSQNQALGGSAKAISIRAVGADIRFQVGTGPQTASATSHFIAQNERLTVGVPASANIAVIRNASTDGTLELSELS